MSIRHGRNVALYINGVDISGDSNAITGNSEQELHEVTTFGALGHTLYPGLAKDTGTIETVYNSTAATVFQNMVQISPSYAMLIMYGQTVGDPAYGVEEVMLKGNVIKSVVTDVNRATMNFDTDNHPFEDCRVLAYKRSEISSGTASTNHDNLTSTLIGGTAYAQTFGVSTGTLTLSIQDSATGAFAGEQTTTCSFTTTSTAGAPTAERKAISGTINRYTRAAWAITVSTCTFAVALKRY